MSEVTQTKKHEKTVYDVGMHKGEDTDFYLKKGFRVIGFEADPDLVAHCRSRFSDEIENGNLVIVEGGITDLASRGIKSRTIPFYKNRENSVWGTVLTDWANRNELSGTSNYTIEVPVVDFSKCLEEYGIPYYLKIDIEGMDNVCLQALKHFKQKPDFVSLESEKVTFGKLLEELNLLKQLGYVRFKAIQQKGISHQKEPNPSKEGLYVGHQFQEGSSGLFGTDLPGEWKDYDQIITEYKSIFRQYELFGFNGKLGKYSSGKALRKGLSFLMQRPIPGWYDTHAQHSNAV